MKGGVNLSALILLCAFLKLIGAADFCSIFCNSNQCNSKAQNDCKSCRSPFTVVAGKCDIDPAVTNWAIADTS